MALALFNGWRCEGIGSHCSLELQGTVHTWMEQRTLRQLLKPHIPLPQAAPLWLISSAASALPHYQQLSLLEIRSYRCGAVQLTMIVCMFGTESCELKR